MFVQNDFVIVEQFVRTDRLPAVLADFPEMRRHGSFPLGRLAFGADFSALAAELEGDDLRIEIERKFAIDLSGRCALAFRADLPAAKIGDFDSELIEEFWNAFAGNALCNLHILVHYGRNSHHISEAIFKATARALRMALESDPRMTGVPSTKGLLAG